MLRRRSSHAGAARVFVTNRPVRRGSPREIPAYGLFLAVNNAEGVLLLDLVGDRPQTRTRHIARFSRSLSGRLLPGRTGFASASAMDDSDAASTVAPIAAHAKSTATPARPASRTASPTSAAQLGSEALGSATGAGSSTIAEFAPPREAPRATAPRIRRHIVFFVHS